MKVAGYCPMGCGQTLFVGDHGHITCSWIDCPDPGRADTILHDQTEHIAIFGEPVTVDGEERAPVSLQHPLRERANGELFDCEIHRRLRDADPRKPGRYRVSIHQPDAYSDSFRSGDAGLEFERQEAAEQ